MSVPHISDRQAEDIRRILATDPQRLRALADKLANIDTLLDRSELDELFSEGVPEDQADALMRFTSAMAFRSDNSGEKLDDVLSALQDALSAKGFEPTDISAYEGIKAVLKDIAGSPSFYCSIKSGFISSVLDRHIHQFKVVVGARPIFLEGRNEIFSMLVHGNVTFVTSDAAESEQHLTFQVDKNQLLRIVKECETAVSKMDALAQSLGQVRSHKVALGGDEE